MAGRNGGWQDLTAVKKLSKRILEYYRELLRADRTNASGKLSETADMTVVWNGTRLCVKFNLQSYWKYVENGRGPGKMPPIEAIRRWIVVKPVRAVGISERSLAYLISRKIGREGTRGRKTLERTMASPYVQNVIQAIREELSRGIEDEISVDINNLR